MTNHDDSKRLRRAAKSQEPTNAPASPRRPATRIQSRDSRLEDFGSDYPTPPPEASGEDF
jgi:hypothetical protein